MFIGRERELDVLEKRFASDRFEFLAVYGRRRVGKTTLLKEFIQDKPAIYFTGIESNEKQNLDAFSARIHEFAGDVPGSGAFLSFRAALDSVFQMAKTKRLILVIDEYPFVARSSRGLSSILQAIIDEQKDDTKLMLILCGSSISYMEDEVLAYKAPLYGRRTGQIKLRPLGFAESCRFLEGFSAEEKAVAYGMVGGTLHYLRQLDAGSSLADNIIDLFLNPNSMLFDEPFTLLRQELQDPSRYTAILSAIAGGASRMSEIASKTGEETNLCSKHLKTLTEVGIVCRETPYGEDNSRKTLYAIADNMFRFWYRFAMKYIDAVTLGAGRRVYRQIEPQLSDYMGEVFEDICKQYLWRLLLEERSPVEFHSLGRWWGNDPVRKTQAEIDIVGEQDRSAALFAECKWTKEKVGADVLETLIQRSRLFSYTKPYCFVFAKSGFTKGCEELASQVGRVSLVSYSNMMEADAHPVSAGDGA